MLFDQSAVRHLWIVGPDHPDHSPIEPGVPLIVDLASAHRRHRGPYSAAGAILRQLVPAMIERHRPLFAAHDVEILAIAPELRSVLPPSRETLTSQAAADERTRLYPGNHTLRLAHGIVDLLVELVRAIGPRSLVVTDVDEADATDAEWLAVLVRRAQPEHLRVVVTSTTEAVAAVLVEALTRYATALIRPATPAEVPAGVDPVAWYVDTDCTSGASLAVTCYQALPEAERQRLHDERAERLEALGEPSLALGAIPFHREHGADPHGKGVMALQTALERCVLIGFYDAVLELGERCARLLDWETAPERCWEVTAKVCTALTALGRPDAAAEHYELARAGTTLTSVHIQAAYGHAMLCTRFYEAERRDHRRARASINTAIALSSLLPEPQQRLFNLTFNENGLALIAMHLGDPEEGLALIEDGLRRLDAELGANVQTLHRSVLRFNRAQLLARTGRIADAIATYGEAIAADPHHSEYYLDRADLYRRIDQPQLALADYAAAIDSSPPYPEPYYNRADLAFERGELDDAVADYTRLIELDPAMVDAFANRAGAYLQLGRAQEARHDVAAGLALDPAHAHLHCLKRPPGPGARR